MIKIRPANFETDAMAIIDGFRIFSQQTPMASWFRDGDGLIEDVSKIMVLENIEIAVADQDGKLFGGIGIVYVPFIWNFSILIGDVVFWWSANNAPFRTGRSLFDYAIQRIEEKGARPQFHTPYLEPEHIEKFYERRGLNKLDSLFTVRGQ